MRLWSKSEEEEHDIDPPADIAGIMAYSALDGDDPRVTIPEQGDLFSRVKGIQVREPEGDWGAL